MKTFHISLALSALTLIAPTIATAQDSRRFTVEDLLKVRRVADPQVSPDGQRIAFTIGDVDLDGNHVVTQIYVVPSDGSGKTEQLTSGDHSATSPRWTPDGKKIAYVTGSQIWLMDADGDNKKQLTKISTGAAAPLWSPDGKWIAFTSDVYPECKDDDCNKRKEEQAGKSKLKAHVTDRLLFRHWDEWRDVKRTHLIVIPAGGGAARDLTPGDFDSPPYAAATGVDFAFSADSKQIAFLRNPDKVEAISTNSDIFVTPVAGGAARNITAGNKGYDVGPVYTSDGKYILYRSQATEGFESDRWRLMAYDRVSGTSTELTKDFDLNVEEVVLAPEGRVIYLIAGERGQNTIYSMPYLSGAPMKPTKPTKIVGNVFATNLQLARDGSRDEGLLIFANSSMAAPTEVYHAAQDGSGVSQLTRINQKLTERANLNKAEDIEWTGAMGRKVHGFIVKPPNFEARKKYPLLVLVHGGPQSAWNDNWGYRWNPQVFSTAGYVVFMPNPRGSTGYGQQFVNEISADWGGRVFTDLKNGVVRVLSESYVDRSNIGAAGASYGGYMVDWIQGHNNDPRFRFKVLVSHAGVYNLTSMYGATEELWFPEWEFKGTPWTNPVMYDRWSPHKFVANFNTPILVTAGELDYRVPYTESLQLFTAVQRKGIDSELLVFSDEGHWILKPQNSQFWYNTVLSWLGKYLKE